MDKLHLTQEGQELIINIKKELENEINNSDWCHLNYFYN